MQYSNVILMAVLAQMSNGLPIMNLFEKRAPAVVTKLITSVVQTTVTVGAGDATTSTTEAVTTTSAVQAAVTAASSDAGGYTTTLSGDGWGPITVTIDPENMGKTTWIQFTPTYDHTEAASSTSTTSTTSSTPTSTEASSTTSSTPTTTEASSTTSSTPTTTEASSTTSSTTSSSPTTTEASSTSSAEVDGDQHNKATSTTTSSSSASSSGDFKTNMLDFHNAKRSLHGVDNLSWDDDAESYAQAYADKYDCSGELTHSGGKYGENLAIGYSDEGTIEAWYGEGDNYNYGSSCSVYDHFTAMIWKSTTSIGCAKKYCGSVWGNYIICSYNPAGNVVTQCDDNVLPLSS